MNFILDGVQAAAGGGGTVPAPGTALLLAPVLLGLMHRTRRGAKAG